MNIITIEMNDIEKIAEVTGLKDGHLGGTPPYRVTTYAGNVFVADVRDDFFTHIRTWRSDVYWSPSDSGDVICGCGSVDFSTFILNFGISMVCRKCGKKGEFSW